MKLTVCVISIVVLALLISPAFAYSSLSGSTGTANLPNAEIAKIGFDMTFDTQNVQGIAAAPLAALATKGTYQPSRVPFTTTTINAQIWHGVYGFGNKLELSGDYIATSRTTKGLSAKYMLNETKDSKNAVGFVYGTTSALQIPSLIGIPPSPDDTIDSVSSTGRSLMGSAGMEMMLERINTVQAYFAHTRTMIAEGNKRPALLGTVGVNYTDETFRDGVGRAFGSLEMRYQNNSIAVDYQTLNTTIEGHSMRSIVARRNFSSGIGVELGWTNSMGVLGGSASRFFFGGNFAYALK